MAINWVCTGKSIHVYQYKNAEDTISNGTVLSIDFMAQINTEDASGVVNELFDTKPVLTEAGVEAFVGLQVYPQGFTVYVDERLTNADATGVLSIGTSTADAGAIIGSTIGDVLYLAPAEDEGGEDDDDH